MSVHFILHMKGERWWLKCHGMTHNFIVFFPTKTMGIITFHCGHYEGKYGPWYRLPSYLLCRRRPFAARRCVCIYHFMMSVTWHWWEKCIMVLDIVYCLILCQCVKSRRPWYCVMDMKAVVSGSVWRCACFVMYLRHFGCVMFSKIVQKGTFTERNTWLGVLR